MLNRTIEPTLLELAEKYPVVTVTGPRQSGKTTLCRKVFADKAYVNLEAPDVRQFAVNDPRGFINTYPGGAVLDEIQRTPDLLSYIQPVIDEDPTPGKYILTGSQQFNIRATLSQSLAGRTGLLKLFPFDMDEIKGIFDLTKVDAMLLHGFYPRLHHMQLNPTQAMADYFDTYVQRDVRQLINIKDAGLFEKFIRLCAGRIGQLLNLNNLGNETGISHTTAREWISILEASYIVFQLPPWYANISKRLIKTPKLYFWDVGLASYLLGIETEKQVLRDPLRGNLFENMIIAEVFKQFYHRGKRPRLFFYRDSAKNEVDLLVEQGQNLFPVEIKSGQTMMNHFLKGLKQFSKAVENRIKGGAVVYGGYTAQARSDWEVWPFHEMGQFYNKVNALFAD